MRIKIDLNRFGVIAQPVVGRIFAAAAGVADAGTDNPFDAPKLGVRSPESAQSKGRGFKRSRGGGVYGGARLGGRREGLGRQSKGHDTHKQPGQDGRVLAGMIFFRHSGLSFDPC
jgi:hypothetical protein